jgi:hypothetical protein
MKKILILAEEYWFEQKEYDDIYVDAEFLLDELAKSGNDYILVKSPKELLDKIKEIKPDNIKAIFMFHDVLSDSFLNNMSIRETIDYYKGLEKDYGIHIYPGIDVTNNFGSKKYYRTLKDNMYYSILPHTIVFNKENYLGSRDENYIIRKLYEYSNRLFDKNFDKIVIKKGYSYEGKQVRFFSKGIDFEDFKEKAMKLNYKKFWNIGTNSIRWERNIDRYYILQGYNSVIKKRENEYRVFFFNSKATYIAFGTKIDNICIDDIENKDFDNFRFINKDLAVEILRFAKKVYNDYLKLFWDKDIDPILFRVDVSYATDERLQDIHSITIPELGKIRIYVNELEIDPTNFFYNKTICKTNKQITDESIQRTMGRLINEYVNKYLIEV